MGLDLCQCLPPEVMSYMPLRGGLLMRFRRVLISFAEVVMAGGVVAVRNLYPVRPSDFLLVSSFKVTQALLRRCLLRAGLGNSLSMPS